MEKKGNFYWIWLLFFILLCSCANNDKKKSDSNIIKLETTTNNNLKINYNSSIIQLETNSESIIGSITKVNVDLPNNRVFVLSNFNIYIFDSSGKFLNKLQVGRGPGEVLMIYSFALDSVNRTLYAIDEGRRLCSFDYNGKMINKYDIKDFASIDVFVLDEDNVLLCRSFVGGQEKHFVGLYSLSKKTIIKKFISSECSSYPKTTMVTASNFSFNNKIYFYSPNVFGLFEYSNSGFDKILTIDLGSRFVPASISDQYKDKNHCELRKKAKLRHYIPYITSAFMFKGHYFVVVDDDKQNCLAMNRVSQVVYNKGPLHSYFNLPDKQSFKYIVGVQEDMLIFSCNPLEFLDAGADAAAAKIGKHNVMINSNHNPFLVLVR